MKLTHNWRQCAFLLLTILLVLPTLAQPTTAINPAGALNGAALVGQSIPASMVSGQSYLVQVTMKNTGTSTWVAGEYKLGSQNPGDNFNWGMHRVALSGNVAPGGNAVFTFNVTAPANSSSTPLVVNMQWGMLQEYREWFGPYSTNVAVSVTAPVAPTITVTRTPATLTATQSYSLSWATTNATSVTRVCTASGSGYLDNSTQATSGNVTATASAAWVGYPTTCTWIASGPGGSSKAFVETVVTNPAPPPPPTLSVTRTPSLLAAGQAFTIDWAASSGADVRVSCVGQNGGSLPLTQVSGSGGRISGVASSFWVGRTIDCTWTASNNGSQSSYVDRIQTTGPALPANPVNDATFVGQTVAASMIAGQTYPVQVTMKNTGNTTWVAGEYKLGSQNPGDNFTWGLNRVSLTGNVAPGANAVFNVNLTAPANNGSTPLAVNMQWRMVQEWREWFGATGSNAVVSVNPIAPTAPTITVTRTPAVMTAGQNFTLSWKVTNTTALTRTCTASVAGGFAATGTMAFDASGNGSTGAAPADVAWVGKPSECAWTATGQGGTSASFRETMTTQAVPGGPVVTYIHTDGLGSPVARTNEQGQIISRTRYEPYGATAGGATPTIGFTGHVNDADTGLTYMQQRYYDPMAGRFMSVDPVLTDANTGSSFNRYVYANNSPYKYIDKDGRESECSWRTMCIRIDYSNSSKSSQETWAWLNGSKAQDEMRDCFPHGCSKEHMDSLEDSDQKRKSANQVISAVGLVGSEAIAARLATSTMKAAGGVGIDYSSWSVTAIKEFIKNNGGVGLLNSKELFGSGVPGAKNALATVNKIPNGIHPDVLRAYREIATRNSNVEVQQIRIQIIDKLLRTLE